MKTKDKEVVADATAEEIIRQHVYWSVGAGFIPLPLIDIAAVTAIQLDMIKQLARLHDRDYSEMKGKSIVSTLTMSTFSSSLARIGASVVKFVPVVGTLAGLVSMPVVSGASTFAVGKTFDKHFAGGGTFEMLEKDSLKKLYEESLAEGEKIAEDMKEKVKKMRDRGELKIKEARVSKRLKELNTLKNENLITEEEFTAMRARVLKEMMGEEA